jgi:predicted metal-dependent phosphoesterase TrpH
MAIMPVHYDLHSHCVASDGTLTPAGLVQAASAAGVNVLALTDHDTTDGIEEADREALTIGLRLIPGVEISVSWESLTVHILGLNIDSRCRELQDGLAGLRAFRDWRAEEIGRRLDRAGIHGAYAGACARSRGRIVSRTHFAQYLVASGHARSVTEVFKRFLTHGKPGHVSGQWAKLEDALGWIRSAGGLPVIAHPARYPITASKLRRLIGEFRELGGVGMEVVSGCHSRDDVRAMAGCARTSGLCASRGSDYHGPENPWVQLGQLADLPTGCRPIWECAEWPVT